MKKYILGAFILMLLLFSSGIACSSDRADDYARSMTERGISPLIITGLISMLPIFELRGGIPVGIAILQQNPFLVYPVAVIFNLIPVFPLLLFLNPIKQALEKLPFFKRIFNFLTKKVERNKRLVERYEELGLLLFVAVPLPITGAWTGSLIAVIMGLKTVKSFIFISLGVIAAGIIVTMLTMLGALGLVLACVLFLSSLVVYIIKFLQARERLTK
ncbi:MAG: small multi-drug export protein [Spirochaetota bacterium]|nr:MAG: small multi-drug export protein [Spirochaetota bacterium]